MAGWSLGAAGSAYGIFVIPTASATPEAQLMGIVYATDSDFKIGVWGEKGDGSALAASASYISSSADRSEPVKIQGIGHRFGIALSYNTEEISEVVTLRDPRSVDKTTATFIRDRLNTNPVATTPASATMWLIIGSEKLLRKLMSS